MRAQVTHTGEVSTVEIGTPALIVLGLAFFVILRTYDQFMQSAASEAGKSFGKKFGDTIAKRVQTKFGITHTLGVIAAVLVTVAFVAAGLGLAFVSSDCDTQKTGYVLAVTSLGVWL